MPQIDLYPMESNVHLLSWFLFFYLYLYITHFFYPLINSYKLHNYIVENNVKTICNTYISLVLNVKKINKLKQELRSKLWVPKSWYMDNDWAPEGIASIFYNDQKNKLIK